MTDLKDILVDFPATAQTVEPISYDTVKGMTDNQISEVIIQLLQRVSALEQKTNPLSTVRITP